MSDCSCQGTPERPPPPCRRDRQDIPSEHVGPHNTVWDRVDPRPGLFDFDDSGWGPFASDLARYLHALRWRTHGDALVAEALEGYQEVAELPEGWDVHSALFDAACDLFAARYYAPQVERRGKHAQDLVDQMMGRVASWLAERS